MSPWDPDEPYQDLPTLPPPGEIETKYVLKALVEARSALAAVNEACDLIPNPTVLINTIPLLEAQSSSEIENIVTTTDELFRFADVDGGLDDSSPLKETLRYRTALRRGFEAIKSKPLSVNVAIEICSCIKNQDVRIRDLPGTKIANPASGEIIYTPPVHSDVIKAKLANWEKFLHEQEDLDPLVRMAVAHYQFEAIHPFFDGNGRTGRVLNILALIQFDLLSLPVLYLSRYIIEHKSDYYRLLNSVTTDGDWEEWLVFMLSAVVDTADWTRKKIRDIRQLQIEVADEIKRELPKIYKRELVDVIFAQPYCRIDNIVSAGLAKRQTASTWLGALVELGVLQKIPVGRNKLFLNHRFLSLLIQR